MPKALITGITGQDGSFLAELLLSKGYHVIGAVRDIQNISESFPISIKNNVELVNWDMLNQNHMSEVLSKHCPAEIYNFAAYSSGTGMYDEAVEVGEINGLAVARILESIRHVDSTIRFCQASSREIFGEASESPQTEDTSVNPRSPYGAAKLYADFMIRIYRKHYKLFASSAILFNHESPRRGHCFVTRKITYAAAKIKMGLEKELRLGNLDAQRDWGYAGDFVRAMWLMLQQKKATDYVIATGQVHSVREFCEIAFNHLGLDYRDYVIEDETVYRSAEPTLLVGSAAKANAELNWMPEIEFRELVEMMVDADMQSLSENN